MTISRRIRISCEAVSYVIMATLAADALWQGYRLHAQTRIAPDQLKVPRFVALACIAPATANSNCAGLVYIDAVTPAGTEIKIIGAPVTVPIDPAAWSIVP